MRVLHLAPLWFPVAADAPGGIETFLFGLIGALERLGCRNALVASGDSDVDVPVVPVVPENLFAQMSAGRALEYAYYEQEQLMLALERATDFDLVHSHIGPGGLVLSSLPGIPVLHTWHTQVYRDLQWLVRRRPHVRFSTVSEFQAARLREQGAVHCQVIQHGVDVGSFPFGPEPSQRLLFVGRLDVTKGADLAVAAARTLGWPLTLAGPITDRAFFERSIEPLLDDTVRYVGIANHREKRDLFRRAGCVLVPSRVEEAGPLVAIEALACGSPVVGLANGGIPELVEDGVTGYSTQDQARLPDLVRRAVQLDRSRIRARAAERFDLAATAQRYRDLYHELAGLAASAAGKRRSERAR